jgi:peptide/nickel transport system substrate-binding protein
MNLKRLSLFVICCVVVLGMTSLATAAMQYKESPMLAERVQKGELPPVEERLPENPIVVEPIGEIGKYGGTIRMGFARRHSAVNSMIGGRFTDQTPFTFSADGSRLEPNWAEDAYLDESAQVFTVHIRKGLRWSDGVPVTVEDFVFTYEDVAFNEYLFPVTPDWIKGAKIEPVDDWTFRLHLPEPYPLYLYSYTLGALFPGNLHPLPKHYMSKFHPKYASEQELKEALQKEGIDDWWVLFELKTNNDNVDRPTLAAWVPVESAPDRIVMERNPYYWRVDTAGNQLPYIDRYVLDVGVADEIVTLKGMAGEYDFIRGFTALEDYPVVKAGEKDGPYSVMLWDGASADVVVAVNLNYQKDKVLGALLQNPEFRKALSYAINRQEINELVFLGTAKARQLSPFEGSSIYDEELAYMHAQYDPAKAKQILDDLGVVDVDGDGWREKPNGERLQLGLIVSVGWTMQIASAELIATYWQDVGIDVDLEVVAYERRLELIAANDYHTDVWKHDELLYPAMQLLTGRGPLGPFHGEPTYGNIQTWLDWIAADGAKGEEPPAAFAELVRRFNYIVTVSDDAERDRLARELWMLYYDNLWTIGVVQQAPSVIMITDRLKNVPSNALNAWSLRCPSNAAFYQWFIDE